MAAVVRATVEGRGQEGNLAPFVSLALGRAQRWESSCSPGASMYLVTHFQGFRSSSKTKRHARRALEQATPVHRASKQQFLIDSSVPPALLPSKRSSKSHRRAHPQRSQHVPGPNERQERAPVRGPLARREDRRREEESSWDCAILQSQHRSTARERRRTHQCFA